MKRREQREQAFLLLFEGMFGNSSDLDDIISNAKFTRNQKYCSYAQKIFVGVKKNKEEIVKMINSNLQEWHMERLSDVVLVLLHYAVYEILFLKEAVPLQVAINEAIELAKKYGGPDDPAFLNSVLGKIVKNLNKNNEICIEVNQ